MVTWMAVAHFKWNDPIIPGYCQLWNMLATDISTATLLTSFCRRLKLQLSPRICDSNWQFYTNSSDLSISWLYHTVAVLIVFTPCDFNWLFFTDSSDRSISWLFHTVAVLIVFTLCDFNWLFFTDNSDRSISWLCHTVAMLIVFTPCD